MNTSQCAYEDCRAELPEKAGCLSCGRCQCGCNNASPICRDRHKNRKSKIGCPQLYIRGHSSSKYVWPSRAKLEEMHWRDNLTLTEIGECLAELNNGHVIKRSTVQARFAALGIQGHSLSWRRKLEYIKHPESLDRARQIMREVRDGSHSPGFTKKSQAKGREVIQKRALGKRVVAKCRNNACLNEVLLKPSQVNPRGNFCSRKCAWRVLGLERRKLIISHQSQTFELPEWARENVERLRQLQQETE